MSRVPGYYSIVNLALNQLASIVEMGKVLMAPQQLDAKWSFLRIRCLKGFAALSTSIEPEVFMESSGFPTAWYDGKDYDDMS